MTYENLPEEQERKHIEDLRARMKGSVSLEMYEDKTVFRRFIRARNYDLDAAETMFRNHLQWRKASKVDTILKDYTPSEIAMKFMTVSNLGYNTDDHPVFYFDFGTLDTRGILKSVKRAEVIQFVTYWLEDQIRKLKEHNIANNKEVEQVHFIFDFCDFSFVTATHKPTLEIYAALLTLYDRHYPERLKQAYIVTTSYYFQLLWVVIKPFLSGRTFQKVWLMSKDFALTELPKHIDPKILPAFLGGQLTDPDGDPLCKKVLNKNGNVPEKFYADTNVPIPRIPGALKLVVNRMSKADVKLLVLNSGYCIEWEFESKSKDIGFALLYKETENSTVEPVELIPRHRVETELSPETGVYQCEKRGVYILEFDNTYSWISAKEIYYKTAIVKKAVGKVSEKSIEISS